MICTLRKVSFFLNIKTLFKIRNFKPKLKIQVETLLRSNQKASFDDTVYTITEMD